MVCLKFFFRIRALFLAAIFVIGSFFIFPLHQAADANPVSEFVARVTLLFDPPRGATPRGRRVGGAGRGPICVLADNQSGQSIRALMPTELMNELEGDLEKPQDGAEFVGGFTVSDKPVFWFYVPYVFGNSSGVDEKVRVSIVALQVS